jgi:hypothetical protein
MDLRTSRIAMPRNVAFAGRVRHLAHHGWRYLDAHHSDFGVALFVVPALTIALFIAETACLVNWLMS